MRSIRAMTPRLLTPEATAGRMGVSLSTLNRWAATPGFPRPIRTAGGHRRWVAEEIDAYLNTRRDDEPPATSGGAA